MDLVKGCIHSGPALILETMQTKLAHCFVNSAVALLAGVAVAFFIANLAATSLVQPHDPVLMVSMRTVFWIFGAAGLTVSLFCAFTSNLEMKNVLILWLSLDVVIYGFCFQWGAAHDILGYLGALAESFEISTSTVSTVLTVVFLYLLAGSSSLLILSWLQAILEEAGEYLRIPCPSCGGKIKFSPVNVGQQIPCPHCQTILTLRKPGELMKMTCVLCGGHVEFPAHALGQKIQCPHCAKTITLLKLA